MKWDLDTLYKGFDSLEYKKDLESLKFSIEDINKIFENDFCILNEDKFILTLEEIFTKYEKIYSLYEKLYCFVFLNISTNSNNKKAIDNEMILKDLNVSIILINSSIVKIISERKDCTEVLHKSEVLSEYRFLIHEFLNMGKHLLPKDLEETMASLYNYGSRYFSSLQESLISKYKVSMEIDGTTKEIPLTECRSLLESSCKETRRKAFESEKKLYKFMEEPLSYAINSIKKSFIYDTKKRGYDSPLFRSLKDNRISEEILNAMFDVVRENLDFFREFLKLKSKLLGNKSERINFYDLFSPTRSLNREIDFEYGKEFLIKNFYDFSNEVGDFVKNAFDKNWIDSEIYEGKVGGAFCSNINPIGESRILLNYTNSYEGIFTLAHELGHAYHGEVLKNERILNTVYPMTIAETASIFFETLICDKAYESADENEKIMILEYELNNACQLVLDIYSRFLFEKEVFKRCEKEFLTPEDLNEIMKKSQELSYGDSMDSRYFKEAWIYKSHYYDFDNHFYNFPYTFGHLFSLGLYKLYLNNSHDFHQKYKLILKNSGKSNLQDLCNMCLIDITKKEFFESSIEILKNKYNNYKKLVC